jgi:hypothetical protein
LSQGELTDAASWGGRPVPARSATRSRGAVVGTGTVVEVATVRVGHASSYGSLLDDRNDQIGLLFIGRKTSPGSPSAPAAPWRARS